MIFQLADGLLFFLGSPSRHFYKRRIPLSCRQTPTCRHFRTTSSLHLNRIIFSEEERQFGASDGGKSSISLRLDDERAKHITNVLNLEESDTIKVGVVGEGLYDSAKIVSITPQELTISLNERRSTEKENPPPPVSLILACPRPRRLSSLLPIISMLGCDKILITGGDKVPKDYFGAKLFWDPPTLTNLLVAGLSQNGNDFRLPKLALHKRSISDFDVRKLDLFFPTSEYIRVVAHPALPSDLNTDKTKRNVDVGGNHHETAPATLSSATLSSILLSKSECSKKKKVVVAVGPEGGYTNREIAFLTENLGFALVDLGPRVLRTDVAVISLMSIVNELIRD